MDRTGNTAGAYPYHRASLVEVASPAKVLFDYLDDPRRLSSHMSKSSWAMGGGSMEFTLDAGGGHVQGSQMRIAGRMLGLLLWVEEAVTEHRPPLAKVWEITREPHLLVIGRYRMGFDIEPRGPASSLRVFIDYALPEGGWRWAGRLLGGMYASWCTRQMAQDARASFSRP